jgi:glycine/D-amino acid oxidase-like deaminating enzyme
MNADGEAANWYQSTQVDNPQRPRLNFELDVDVCVIGGGLAGLTTALEVARRGWSVAVLEAGRVGAGASGRNGGFVLPGFSENIDRMVERIGLDHAKELWSLSQRGVDYVRNAIAEHAMQDVDPVDGWLDVSKTDNWRDLQNHVERLRWIGVNVEAWPVERVRSVLASERYFGAMHYPGAFHIHPVNYTIGLARAAEAAGARIFEMTPALEIDAAGVRKRIQTIGTRVRAAHVVLATNVPLGPLMPQLAATLMPITTYVMETEPLGAALGEAIRYPGGVSDGARFENHYRVISDDRLQWAGRMTVWQSNPRRFARNLVSGVRRIFPQLGRVKIADIWSGTFGRTLHNMPQIGEIEPGVWVANGFGRHGLNASALAGELVARGIVEKDDTWRLFAPYELVWAGGKLFRALAQTTDFAARPKAALRGALARQRERQRKRRDARALKRRAALGERQTRHARPTATKAPPTKAAVARPQGANSELLPTPAILPEAVDGPRGGGKPPRRSKRAPPAS